jgi:hypothetical protein
MPKGRVAKHNAALIRRARPADHHPNGNCAGPPKMNYPPTSMSPSSVNLTLRQEIRNNRAIARVPAARTDRTRGGLNDDGGRI